jgi:predicted membrane-bound spermidine synthase
MPHKLHRPSVYALIMLFSACSTTYELTLARLFAVLSSQEIIWHSVTIAMYVLALGVGTACSDRLSQRWQRQWMP